MATDTRTRRRAAPQQPVDDDPAPAPRAGTAEVDLNVLAALRTWLYANDAYHDAKRALDAARAALDTAAGTIANATHNGAEVFTYRARSRRSVDLARLEEHHIEAYKDCLRQTSHYHLVVDDEHDRILRAERWRAKLRRRAA